MIVKEEIFSIGKQTPNVIPDQARDKALRAWLLFASLLGVIVVSFQGLWHHGIPLISNVYITDSLTLYYSLLSGFNIQLANLLDSHSLGLLIFYGPINLIDHRLFFIPNIAIWLGCIWAAHRIFYPIHKHAALFATIAIVFNPYLLLSLSGPTKELPLLFLILLFLLVDPSWKRLPYFAVLILITYLIRDGYGLMMLAWLAVHLLAPKKLWRLSRVILCLVPLLILLGLETYASPLSFLTEIEQEARWISQGASTSSIGEDNIERALKSLNDPTLAAREYGFRLIANGFSDLIRPTFTTVSNRISLLGVGFFIHGYFLAFGLAAVILTIFSPFEENRLQYLAWFVVLAWSVIGLILFIQPRYLMPVTPIAMGILGSRTTAARFFIIIGSIAVGILGFLFLTYILNIPPVIAIDNPVKPPFFFGD